jgi:hypothetical protein
MIPKLIHCINPSNTWYQSIKKQNHDWKIVIWKNTEIKKELNKYPKLLFLYNKTDSINSKNILALYIIMKDHGGVFYDVNENNNISCSLNDLLFDNQINDIIYISVCVYFGIYSMPCLNFMAMEQNHPIWENVIKKLEHYSDNYAIYNTINNTFENCLYISNYPIIELFKKNNSFQIWQNTNYLNKQLNIHFIKIILFITVIIIIFIVEKLYHYNVSLYGAINFIPGIGIVSSSPEKKKKK